MFNLIIKKLKGYKSIGHKATTTESPIYMTDKKENITEVRTNRLKLLN